MIDLLNERIRRTGEEPSSPDRNPLARLYHSTSGSNRKTSTRSSQGDSHFTLYTKDDKKRTKRDSKDSSGSTKDKKDPSLLRKRTPTTPEFPHRASPDSNALKSGQTILTQIGTPDHNGWMRKKGDHYGSWKNRYFVLKGPHLYWLKSNAQTVGCRVASHLSVIERLIGLFQETKIKGYVNIVGYRIISDENIDPGRYGFRLVHDTDRDHFFSSDEQVIIREWMKALMKATIDRDYTSASIIL